jgi:hypothetical protein
MLKAMPKRRRKEKKRVKKGMPPSSYITMPHYFPTEQVDILRKIRLAKRRKKK